MPLPTLVHRVHSPHSWHRSSSDNRGKRNGTRKDRTKRLLTWAGIVFVALFVVGALTTVAAFAWFSRDLPDPNKINDRVLAQSTKIYDRTGEHLLYDVHGNEKRTVVSLSDISEYAKKATVTAEDKNFYRHKGIDFRGFVRAVLKNVIRLNPSGQGGSTITQQFIKNSILTPEKSYIRKIKEAVLAYQLEKRFSKDEILQLYLNEIPYGSNAYGIEAAAQNYFGTSAKNLTLSQGALLAALPRAPTYYSPYGNNVDALNARHAAILDSMVEEGYVTREEADAAKNEKIVFRPRREGIIAPHFVFYVRELLTEKYGEETVEQGGLKVITTLDLLHQEAGEAAIAEYVEKNEKQWNASNAAMVSLDTKTGQILAMVGSRDYFNIENDGNVNVALRPRQPGSSFKPVVYTSAFERGYTPETMVFDLVTNFDTGSGKPYVPHNYDSREHGPVSLRKALAGSLNIPAVKTLYLAGVNNVLDNADELGYTTLKDRERFGLSLVLGGAEVKLLEHTSAYATLAREGIRHPTTPILRVESRNGKTLEQYEKKEIRVLDEVAVRNVNDILSDNSARSFIFGSRNYLTLPDRPVAAKTGTTNDYRDAWTLGFTPSIAAGFWVGRNDNTEMKRGADGSVVAAPMWNSYMKKVLSGTPVETFKKPPANDAEKPILRGQIDVVHELPVDRLTGNIIPDSCRDSYPKLYITKKKFKEAHTILHWVQKSDPRGDPPANPSDDPQYSAWEKPVQEWTKKNKYPDLKKLTYEQCDRRENVIAPTITITSPARGMALTEPSNAFAADVAAADAVTSVTFSIDGEIVHAFSSQPYSLSYLNTQFTNGDHTFRVSVVDAAGNLGEESLPFSYNLSEGAAVLSFVSPQNNAVVTAEDFPLDITVQAFHPSGVRRVELFRGSESLASNEDPRGSTIQFSVQSLPEGSSTLTLRMTPRDGDEKRTTLTLRSSSGE
jgi:1A family penicillin-binding protein